MQAALIGCISGTIVFAITISLFVFRYRTLTRIRMGLGGKDTGCVQQANRSLEEFGLACQDLTANQQRELAVSIVDRERGRLPRQAAVVSLLLAATVGLATFRAAESVLDWSLVPQTVEVIAEGASRHVEIPPNGISLLRVLTESGQSLSGEDYVESPSFVSLRRTDEHTATHVYYLPLLMVLGGIAGDISLQPGDIVRIVRWETSSLGVLQSTHPGVAFEVTGHVEQPGRFKTLEVSETIMNATTSEYAGSFDVDGVTAEVVIVTRQSPGGSPIEHFFVPIAEPYLNFALLQSRVYDGDLLEYALLKDVPLFGNRNTSPK